MSFGLLNTPVIRRQNDEPLSEEQEKLLKSRQEKRMFRILGAKSSLSLCGSSDKKEEKQDYLDERQFLRNTERSITKKDISNVSSFGLNNTFNSKTAVYPKAQIKKEPIKLFKDHQNEPSPVVAEINENPKSDNKRWSKIV